MVVPFFSLVPPLLASVLLALFRSPTALLLPLVFHASYLIRSEIALGGLVVPTTFLELLLFVAVLFGIARRPRGIMEALRAVPKSAVVLTLLFVMAATLSAVAAPHQTTAWGHWKAFVVEPIVYALVLLPLLREPRGRRLIAGALLLGGLVSSGISLAVSSHTSDFGRLQGVYDVPNSLALVLAPLTVFASVLAVGNEMTSVRRLARWSLALFVPVLLLTQSLGGLLAAVAGLVLQHSSFLLSARKAETKSWPRARWSCPSGRAPAATEWRDPRLAITGAAVLVLAAGLGWQAWSGKLAHAISLSSPLAARVSIWRASLALVREHPVIGTGLGTFEPAYQAKLRQLITENAERGTLRSRFRVSSSQFPLEWVVRDPHNIILSFWLNTGLLGLLSMTGLVGTALRRVWTMPHAPGPMAAAGALVALLLFGFVDVPYLKNDLSLLWWTYVAFILAASRPPSTRDPLAPSQTAG